MDVAAGAARPRIVAIGNLDGVHRGHRALLVDAVRDGERRGLGAAVLTFEPHPAKVLGRLPPPMLTRPRRKAELCARVPGGVETIVRRFDAAFAAQTPEDFATHVLAEDLGARVVVVGHNFRFGRAREGDFDRLTDLGKRLGFETRSQPLMGDDLGPWSSTRIREAVVRGELESAAEMLGRPHMISGVVTKGEQRGRTLGFPTANLTDVEEALPPWGVYAVLVDLELPPAVGSLPARVLATGVANLGVRPTIAAGKPMPTIEVHLFDLDQNLYGARLRVHLITRLRGEERFASLDALKHQIADDARRARELLAEVEPDSQALGAWC